MTDFDIIDAVIAREGGYSNRPADKGGPTKYGVTLSTLQRWRGPDHPIAAIDVQNLGAVEARAILYWLFVKAPGFDAVSNPTLRAFVVDCGVNHGAGDATKFLQRALGGLVVDGAFGPKTRAAVNAADVEVLYVKACAARVRYQGVLIAHDRSQAEFAAGWADRVADFLDATPF